MRLILLGLLSGFSLSAFAEEAVPEVGKHVASNMDATSMVMSLLMVLALIIISAVVLKKFQPQANNTQGLKIIASLHLGAKEKLVVVEVGDKQMLLGVTGQQINLIDTLDEKISVNSPITAELGVSLINLFNRKKNDTAHSHIKEPK